MLKKPLCLYNGKVKELQSGDTLPGGGGESFGVDRKPTASQTVQANFGVYAPGSYEIANGTFLEIADGGSFEVG